MEIKHLFRLNRQWAACLLCFFSALSLHAQIQEVTIQQINDIKLRAAEEHYLTEQMMADKADEASFLLCAKGLLSQIGGGYSLNDIRPFLHQLVAPRGNRKLVFVYIDRDDLGRPSGALPSTPVPVQQQQTPAVPVQQQQTPVEPVQQQTPVEPAKPSVPAATPPYQPSSATDAALMRQPSFMLEIMNGGGLYNVMQSLQLMRDQGIIADFGGLADNNDTSDCYIIIFRAKEPYAPITILTPVLSNGHRHNLRSRETDDIDNHAGCKAIWLRAKQ